MKKSIYIIAAILCLVTTGCGGIGASHELDADTLYAPRYANHFVLLSRGDTVILRVKNPWQGAQNVNYDYVLGNVPQRVITMSSSHSAFIEELESEDNIIGVSGPQYLSSRILNKLPDVGFDNSLNYEVIVSLAPDLLTTYEISGQNSPGNEKLRALGINTMYIADYLENSPLAKAEWIVAFGAIMGKLDNAKWIFEGVEKRYNALKKEVNSHFASHLDRPHNDCKMCSLYCKKPIVMLNSPYKDVWYLPGDSSYVVALIHDAGGIYAGGGVSDNVSRSVSIEAAYTMIEKSDIWLHPSSTINSAAELRAINPLLKNISIPIYNNNARQGTQGGSDFWESGVLRCDVVLKDLISIFHHGLLPNHTLYYYKEIR